MYLPDWSVVRQLKAYDERLEVRWLDRRQRWGVFRRVPARNRLYDREVLIHIVQRPGGGFRPLDLRVLWELQQADHHRRSRNDILREMVESQQRREEGERRKFRDDLAQISREVRPLAARLADEAFGAANVPKEDLALPEETEAPMNTASRVPPREMRRKLSRRLARRQ